MNNSTPKVSDTVQNRIDESLGDDREFCAAEGRFYAVTAKLEKLDPKLFAELDAAWVDVFKATQRGAFVAGWRCGRDPELLVFAQEGDE
jgi:hypothetical protein